MGKGNVRARQFYRALSQMGHKEAGLRSDDDVSDSDRERRHKKKRHRKSLLELSEKEKEKVRKHKHKRHRKDQECQDVEQNAPDVPTAGGWADIQAYKSSLSVVSAPAGPAPPPSQDTETVQAFCHIFHLPGRALGAVEAWVGPQADAKGHRQTHYTYVPE